MDKDEYLKRFELLDNADTEQARSFDKSILTLATGALGITITFANKIVPEIKADTSYFIVITWIGLGLSVVFTLISFISSQYACKSEIAILENTFHNKNGGATNIASLITSFLNWTSIICFIIGAIYWGIFLFKNLNIGA